MEITDIPSEVWFLVPFEHNEGLIKELEANANISTTGETCRLRSGVLGRSFKIDLLSLDKDELEQIILRLPGLRSASP
jgi:hypothetical protein